MQPVDFCTDLAALVNEDVEERVNDLCGVNAAYPEFASELRDFLGRLPPEDKSTLNDLVMQACIDEFNGEGR